jgi:hypothetical protein
MNQRVARELEGRRAWIAPELAAIRALAASADGPVEVALFRATELSARGEVAAPRELPRALRLVAVLATPVRIVERIAGTTVTISRAFSEMGVLDVTADGLVIVELARGVSAIDLQHHAEPTLLISPRVGPMEP